MANVLFCGLKISILSFKKVDWLIEKIEFDIIISDWRDSHQINETKRKI